MIGNMTLNLLQFQFEKKNSLKQIHIQIYLHLMHSNHYTMHPPHKVHLDITISIKLEGS